MSLLADTHRKAFLRQAKETCKDVVETLEGSCPRWETVFKTKELDVQEAQTRILNFPKRPMVKPCVKFLRSVKEAAIKCQEDWGLQETPFDIHIQNRCDAATDAGETYMIIVAAVNTVIHMQSAANADQQAENCFKIAEKKKGFEFPALLAKHLKEMQDGHTTTLARVKQEKSGSKQKKADVKAEAVPEKIEAHPAKAAKGIKEESEAVQTTRSDSSSSVLGEPSRVKREFDDASYCSPEPKKMKMESPPRNMGRGRGAANKPGRGRRGGGRG